MMKYDPMTAFSLATGQIKLNYNTHQWEGGAL